MSSFFCCFVEERRRHESSSSYGTREETHDGFVTVVPDTVTRAISELLRLRTLRRCRATRRWGGPKHPSFVTTLHDLLALTDPDAEIDHSFAARQPAASSSTISSYMPCKP
jgi:hypothetical protein